MGNWFFCRNKAGVFRSAHPVRRFIVSAQAAHRLCALLLAIGTAASVSVSSAQAQARLTGERFPETRLRYLRARDMDKYSNSNMQYAINELLARRQYLFQTPSLERRFLQFSWYRPRPERTLTDCVLRMTPVERNNHQLMVATLRARRNGGGTGGGSTTAYRFPQTAQRIMGQTEVENLSECQPALRLERGVRPPRLPIPHRQHLSAVPSAELVPPCERAKQSRHRAQV